MPGLQARNINTLHTKHICPVCSLILRHPLQINTCGHRLCQSCFRHNNQATFTCPQCQTPAAPHQIAPDRGFNNDMQSLPLLCSLCQWNGVLRDYHEHLVQAHPHHEQIIDGCVLKDFGCDEEVSRSGMTEHYRSRQHQEVMMKMAEQIKSQSRGGQMSHTDDGDGNGSILQDFDENVDVLGRGIAMLNEAIDQDQAEIVEYDGRIRSLTESVSKIKLSIQEESAFLEATKQNLDVLRQQVTSLEGKVDNWRQVSNDGTYTWKISGFREKLNDARSERQTSIYSPPFYSSPSGYKMRARLYLHGDGNARRTHMSLFFVLMRGPNDAVLKFPFNYKVTFCLYDQTPQQRHIIDSFRPDIKSNSFQRPRTDMNIASGIPKFAQLAIIEQEGNPYVRDDAMFIRIIVDFNETPKTLLPYVLSLNPGMPIHVQQKLMREEEKKRAVLES
ncbi:unnamed protein product [Adineta ricciae]|uniref:RING-type domain-containing protein n=1 Tax=Adineta ricciae TaxID=249248 RepID=A0A813WN19_ADIRI|nr:unnamed protein product [Adineta ricciae]